MEGPIGRVEGAWRLAWDATADVIEAVGETIVNDVNQASACLRSIECHLNLKYFASGCVGHVANFYAPFCHHHAPAKCRAYYAALKQAIERMHS